MLRAALLLIPPTLVSRPRETFAGGGWNGEEEQEEGWGESMRREVQYCKYAYM